jgi:hypothetical protein
LNNYEEMKGVEKRDAKILQLYLGCRFGVLQAYARGEG